MSKPHGTPEDIIGHWQSLLGEELTQQVILEAHASAICGHHKGEHALMPEVIQQTIPVRRRLLEDRVSITHKFKIGGVRCYLIVSLYPDGKPGEIFLKTDQVGTTAHGFADSWSLLFSMSLQYGIPLEVLIPKFSFVKFEPRGKTDNRKNKELSFADSIVDYVVRWLEIKFVDKKTPAVAMPAGAQNDQK